ncbi:MAG: NADPH:quinone reductase [Rhodospirillaceae bacterium]
MRAWCYEKAGTADDVLRSGEREAPEPSKGEVRVRVRRSAVNPTDAKRRENGRELGLFSLIIPDNDGSGVIEAVGEGVDAARIGERVWIFGAQAGRPLGTAADYCVLPSRQARHLPDGQSFDDGACLGVPAVTAHRGCFGDGPIDGKWVLITGGTGRVGRYAVQIAKIAGAKVIATAGTPAKAADLAGLGADHVVNYREEDLVAAVKEITSGVGVDRFIDVAFGVNITNVPSLVRTNGVVTSYGSDAVAKPEIPFLALMYANILVRPFAIFAMPREAQDAAFADIEKWCAEGALDHVVAERFAFEQLPAAHKAIESGALTGCCLVTVSDD